MRVRLVPAGLLLTLNIRRVATAWEPTAPQRSSISRGRAVCDAAGAIPADLEIPGTEHLTTSDQFLELDEVPTRILFIGGVSPLSLRMSRRVRDRRSQSSTVSRALLPFLTRISLISSLSGLANSA